MRVAISCCFLVLAACAGARVHPRPTTGGIAGLARDHDSGDPIAKADIHVRAQGQMRPLSATSSDRGLYDLDRLSPGRYTLTAVFAGQSIEVVNIDVRAGEMTMVDLVFTLGRPEPIHLDFGDPKLGAIDRYHPRELSPQASLIEGTVNDTATRLRVPGAVVTAVADRSDDTQQTVSDDQGRFRFDPVAPGVYSVSAYYSVGGRGQIEVRRGGIEVAGAEAVVVPLWIELQR